MSDDIHNTPMVESTGRMHLLDDLDCWCKPDWKLEANGRIVIHHEETT